MQTVAAGKGRRRMLHEDDEPGVVAQVIDRRDAPGVSCRRIEAADLPTLAHLLTEGFPKRTLAYWRRALAVLASRPPLGDYPQFGFLLEAAEGPVGVLLTLFMPPTPGFTGVRCNFSSWYVRSEHRTFAHVLVARLFRFRDVAIVNISPAPHTWTIIEAQGFRRYSDGLFAGLAWLSPARGVRVRRLRAHRGAAVEGLPEAELLLDHARLGCLVLIADIEGERRPFVFVRRRIKRSPRLAAQLVYCRDTRDLVACAGALGGWLLLRAGLPVVVCDASGPLAGLAGRYFADYTPKYFRGAAAPPLNDLAYSELPLFGA